MSLTKEGNKRRAAFERGVTATQDLFDLITTQQAQIKALKKARPYSVSSPLKIDNAHCTNRGQETGLFVETSLKTEEEKGTSILDGMECKSYQIFDFRVLPFQLPMGEILFALPEQSSVAETTQLMHPQYGLRGVGRVLSWDAKYFDYMKHVEKAYLVGLLDK